MGRALAPRGVVLAPRETSGEAGVDGTVFVVGSVIATALCELTDGER